MECTSNVSGICKPMYCRPVCRVQVMFLVFVNLCIAGLCGVYNNDVADDLTLRDGSMLSANIRKYQQPSNFIKSWR